MEINKRNQQLGNCQTQLMNDVFNNHLWLHEKGPSSKGTTIVRRARVILVQEGTQDTT